MPNCFILNYLRLTFGIMPCSSGLLGEKRHFDSLSQWNLSQVYLSETHAIFHFNEHSPECKGTYFLGQPLPVPLCIPRLTLPSGLEHTHAAANQPTTLGAKFELHSLAQPGAAAVTAARCCSVRGIADVRWRNKSDLQIWWNAFTS